MGETTAIIGGLVIDGTGAAAREADVVIRGGVISEIGKGLTGDRVIDARGSIVAPGFIDVHTHYDAQLFWDPLCSLSSWHGVTSVVIGNCGYGLAPCRPENRDRLIEMLVQLEDIPRDVLEAGIDWSFTSFREYMDRIDQLRPSLNVAVYLGHSPIRIDVMGDAAFERTANDEEIARMCAIVRQAMADGAIGIATSSSPTGRLSATLNADVEELTALGRAMAESGTGVLSAVPGGKFLSHEQLYDMQTAIGRPITYTALMHVPDGSHRQRESFHRERYALGAAVHPQVSCRPIVAGTTLRRAFALRTKTMLALEGAPDEARLTAYRDLEWRARTARESLDLFLPLEWDRWTITTSPTAPQWEGLTVADIAGRQGKPPMEAMFDLVVADALDTRFTVQQVNYDEVEVTRLLGLEGAIMGLADSGAHPDQICDAVMPTDFLANWVRDKKVMPLEKAVRKLTGELGDMLNIDRGYLRVGSPADVTVFDLDALDPGPVRRVNDLPAGGERIIADQTRGLRHVLVNGSAFRLSGEALSRPAEGGSGVLLGRQP